MQPYLSYVTVSLQVLSLPSGKSDNDPLGVLLATAAHTLQGELGAEGAVFGGKIMADGPLGIPRPT